MIRTNNDIEAIMDFEITQSEIDEILRTLPLADILIDALLAIPDLKVKVIKDTQYSGTSAKLNHHQV